MNGHSHALLLFKVIHEKRNRLYPRKFSILNDIFHDFQINLSCYFSVAIKHEW